MGGLTHTDSLVITCVFLVSATFDFGENNEYDYIAPGLSYLNKNK